MSDFYKIMLNISEYFFKKVEVCRCMHVFFIYPQSKWHVVVFRKLTELHSTFKLGKTVTLMYTLLLSKLRTAS